METIGDHPKEKIECEFNDDSLDFKIHDFKGKNFRLKVSSLFDLIDPMESIMRVKQDKIEIVLVKKNVKEWGNLHKQK